MIAASTALDVGVFTVGGLILLGVYAVILWWSR